MSIKEYCGDCGKEKPSRKWKKFCDACGECVAQGTSSNDGSKSETYRETVYFTVANRFQFAVCTGCFSKISKRLTTDVIEVARAIEPTLAGELERFL